MHNELFDNEGHCIAVVALEFSKAIVGALKSRRNRVNPESVYQFCYAGRSHKHKTVENAANMN